MFHWFFSHIDPMKTSTQNFNFPHIQQQKSVDYATRHDWKFSLFSCVSSSSWRSLSKKERKSDNIHRIKVLSTPRRSSLERQLVPSTTLAKWEEIFASLFFLLFFYSQNSCFLPFLCVIKRKVLCGKINEKFRWRKRKVLNGGKLKTEKIFTVSGG